MARQIKTNEEYMVYFNIHEPWIASALLLLWTMFIPQFFKSKPVNE